MKIKRLRKELKKALQQYGNIHVRIEPYSIPVYVDGTSYDEETKELYLW